jgi:predicted dehydrogenase
MTTNIGFIGLKGHWYAVAEEIPALRDVRLAAVADDDGEALRRAREFPGATRETKTYLDYREMLEEQKLDLVVEAGNDRDRADIVVACVERGVNVIAEKPLAKDLQGLERVKKAVESAGVQVSMLITMRCAPNYRAMKEVVSRGLVGTITQAGAQKSYKLGERPTWQRSRETFSGIIPFIGIHVMDLIRWITGREFVEVMAYASNVAHPEMGDLEDNACVIARLDNGASAAIRLDYCRPAAAPTHGDDRVRIAGDRGVVETIEGRVSLITGDRAPRELALPERLPFLADFLDAAAKKRRPFIPFSDCVRITEVVLRAREAAEIGRPVKI